MLCHVWIRMTFGWEWCVAYMDIWIWWASLRGLWNTHVLPILIDLKNTVLVVYSLFHEVNWINGLDDPPVDVVRLPVTQAALSLSLSSPTKPKPLTDQRSAASEIFSPHNNCQFETSSSLLSSLSHRFSSSLPFSLRPHLRLSALSYCWHLLVKHEKIWKSLIPWLQNYVPYRALSTDRFFASSLPLGKKKILQLSTRLGEFILICALYSF